MTRERVRDLAVLAVMFLTWMAFFVARVFGGDPAEGGALVVGLSFLWWVSIVIVAKFIR